MKLDLSQIRAVTLGAQEITLEEDGFHFYRFNRQQQEIYRQGSRNSYYKAFATSGIKLQFATDSKDLTLEVAIQSGSSRSYFSVDVFADGVLVGYLDNIPKELPEDYTVVSLPLGEYKKHFSLEKGNKTVSIYLPWSACAVIKSLELEDGATLVPVKPKYKLLAFGDSITQGYDALRPSHKYITRLAEAMDAQEYNKGIGGEVFYPPLAQAEDCPSPDYIFVAYGTNDWNDSTAAALFADARAFYGALSEKYPQAKIFALTPVWRKDWQLPQAMGPFAVMEQAIASAVEDLQNVTVISCFDTIPKDPHLYADLWLHPNDAGFDHYFKNLLEKLRATGKL